MTHREEFETGGTEWWRNCEYLQIYVELLQDMFHFDCGGMGKIPVEYEWDPTFNMEVPSKWEDCSGCQGKGYLHPFTGWKASKVPFSNPSIPASNWELIPFELDLFYEDGSRRSVTLDAWETFIDKNSCHDCRGRGYIFDDWASGEYGGQWPNVLPSDAVACAKCGTSGMLNAVKFQKENSLQ